MFDRVHYSQSVEVDLIVIHAELLFVSEINNLNESKVQNIPEEHREIQNLLYEVNRRGML